MTRPVRVRIVYCAECGYEDQALDLARDLMVTFGERLSAIEIVPWEEGTFDVRVGEELVHSMSRDGGFPQAEKIREAVRRALAS